MTSVSVARSPPPTRKRLVWTFFDAALLWMPSVEAKGWKGPVLIVCAFLLFSVRQVILPLVLFGLGLLVFSPFTKSPDPNDPVIRLGVLLVLAVVEEAGRYSFARRASRPGRAIVIFTIAIIATETLLYALHQTSPLPGYLLTRAPSWSIHILAGAGLWWALTHRQYLTRILLVIVVLHTAFNFTTSVVLERFMPSNLESAQAQQAYNQEARHQ